tara:strand:- start:645 stop:863 length:219 start_codon:yes stop_codon:yes gene_type:complete
MAAKQLRVLTEMTKQTPAIRFTVLKSRKMVVWRNYENKFLFFAISEKIDFDDNTATVCITFTVTHKVPYFNS